MSPFIEDKTPLTTAFSILLNVDNATFLQVDDFQFKRSINRSLGRSEHRKLLVVGAHASGAVAEDALVCAHIHADDTAINYFWIDQLDPGGNALRTVKSTGHIEFHAPFSGVGDDSGDAKAIKRVEAIISYYFLAAGHLKELLRFQNGERPVSIRRSRAITVNDDDADDVPAINPSVLRPATLEKKAPPMKREGDNIDVQNKPPPKRSALGSLSTNVARQPPKESVITKLPMPSFDETTRLRVQIASLTAEKVGLQQKLVDQGYAYRGCQVVLDETTDKMAELEAKLRESEEKRTELEIVMKSIRELTDRALA